MNPPSDIAALRRASAMQPDSAELLHQLANALLGADELSESIAAYQQSLALQPDSAIAWNNVGVALKRAGRLNDAVDALARALALKADYAEAHNNLGNILSMLRQWDQAIECFRRAISLRPNFDQAVSNLGNALLANGDSDGAIACYRRAIEARPNSEVALNNLANALCSRGDLPEAMAACRAAIAAQPDFADAHLSLGLMLLLQGDMERGWEEYQWRWKAKDLGPPPVNFPQPRWNGRDLHGRRLLIHAEQGLGDTIQFARYVPLVTGHGGGIIFACPTTLTELLRQLRNVEVVTMDQPLPGFDVHCPLLDLPRIFETTLNTIPSPSPRLIADPTKVAQWRERLAPTARPRIGLTWAGQPAHRMDQQRSFAPSIFAPLAAVRAATFVSLQKLDIQKLPRPFAMKDWTGDLHSMADTAALIENLDLVITADTAVAHLAGAMAKPAWVLLPFAPDWRWLLNRGDSPWYPTLRLFRQTKAGDWSGPVQQVAEALRTF